MIRRPRRRRPVRHAARACGRPRAAALHRRRRCACGLGHRPGDSAAVAPHSGAPGTDRRGCAVRRGPRAGAGSTVPVPDRGPSRTATGSERWCVPATRTGSNRSDSRADRSCCGETRTATARSPTPTGDGALRDRRCHRHGGHRRRGSRRRRQGAWAVLRAIRRRGPRDGPNSSRSGHRDTTAARCLRIPAVASPSPRGPGSVGP